MIEDIGIGDQAWSDVLQAMDRSYAELVDYQEQLEARNAELTNLRRFLSSIMTSISDYLIVTDRDGLIAESNEAFREAVDRSIDTLDAKPICGFFDGAHCTAIQEAIGRTLTTRQDTRISAKLTTAAGVEPVEFSLSPRLDRRGKPVGVVLTGRPMGELLRAYSELEDSMRELKETQGQLVRNEKMASLGRLLAGVAHELNNPISFVYANTHTLEKYLTRIETYFEHVQNGASREELVALREELRLERNLSNLRSAVQGARDGSERVRDIVEDLRRLSAEGAGEMAEFDLVETAQVAANWVKRGAKSDVIFVFHGLSSCTVIGRPGHMQQVLMNLVQNAVDAMEEVEAPEVRFDVRAEEGKVIMDVCDLGPGIPEDVAQKIFDPFFTTKEVGKGTGLGLSICNKIVEEHGGQLELVRSMIGACMRITLPLPDPAPGEAAL